jgi:IS30 family transposase
LYGEIKEEPELKGHFRRQRACRKARGGKKDRRGQIPDRKLTGIRPEIVDRKIRVGDWEGDTVEGAGKTAYIATFVDKTTKVLKGKVMPNKAAATLNKAAVRAFRSIPDEYIKTVTAGNGKEFSGHKGLARELGCDIYFAHPSHSWERGLNEHANGLIRQYLPKGTSFEGLTQRRLDRIIEKIKAIYSPSSSQGCEDIGLLTRFFPSIFSHFKLELAT